MAKNGALETARVEFRMSARLKEEVEDAAALLGVSLTAFATESMVQRAREVKKEHSLTKLYDEDREVFADLVLNPPQPTEALRKLMKTKVRPKRG